MDRDPTASSAGGWRRRSVLAAGAGLTGALAGCVRDVRTVVNRDEIEQLSLTITTLPADGDREGIQLARRLAENLEAVGVDVSIDLRSNEEFLRAILVNHDYDLYVGRHPGATDPDFLYEALHSIYADESGWQNPFGFTSMLFDDLLEDQRAADGEERREAVATMLEELAREQPFVPVCVPDEYRLVRTDRFDGWDDHLATRLGYLGLEPLAEGADARLRATVMDARPSENVNPLSAEYRNRGTVVDLLYDSLATETLPGSSDELEADVDTADPDEDDALESEADSDLLPWLAESWEWEGSTVEVTIREDCRFHDGELVTADDVAFTYDFLADTSRGNSDVPAPSPRYRGQAAAIEEIEVHDERTLSLSVSTGRAVAERAFTVPVLPEHVWGEREAEATVRGVSVAQGTTEALVTDNVPAVGSGPFRFESRTEREHLTLERFEEHFTRRDGVDLPEATVEELRLQIDPRSASAIALVDGGDADVTSTPLEMYSLAEIPDAEETRLLESPSQTFYHVGFNARNAPFGNPYFRRAVARLLDKEWLAETVFEGHATPIATPVDTPLSREWVPDELAWDGEDPVVPFVGSDGDLDVAAAKAGFEDAGFRYGEGGDLLVRR
ncbi:ABC transporter substrate-binding protein [Natrononativus amylolyticus]|uniref:ABC transporter substrate-binding protein n=1 Tax=Natrononativus amylolyticus TaxID=2963434 RepID=UPI0020CFCB68|nr:ABC transporter substrate-binding protein [Natrononativus amylolyticus]